MGNKQLKAFDFDGTLFKKDSVKICYKLMLGKWWFIRYYQPYMYILFSPSKSVEITRRNQLSNWLNNSNLEQKLNEIRNDFWFDDFFIILNEDYYNVIISASYKEILLILLKDILEVDEILAVSVHGNEPRYDFERKLDVYKEHFGEKEIEAAYGDTVSDFPLLGFAKKGYLRKQNILLDFENYI